MRAAWLKRAGEGEGGGSFGSHLAWCHTGVQLGVALINSSLLLLLAFFLSLRSAAQMGSVLRTNSYQRCGIFSSLNLPELFWTISAMRQLFFFFYQTALTIPGFNDYLMTLLFLSDVKEAYEV